MCACVSLSDGPLRQSIAIVAGPRRARSIVNVTMPLTFAFRFVDELNDTVVGQSNILSAEMRAENWVEVGKFELESILPAPIGVVGGHEQSPVASDSTQRLHTRIRLRGGRKFKRDEFVVAIERHGRKPFADSGEDVIDGETG